MSYDSLLYILLFLPVCLAAYQLAPKGWRRRVLLVSGYVFFYLFSGKLLVYLLGTTLLVSLYRHLAGVAEIGGKSCRRRSFGERAEGGKSVIPETEQTGASAGNCTSAGRTGISEIL